MIQSTTSPAPSPTPLSANRGLRARILAAAEINLAVRVGQREVLIRVPKRVVLRALPRLRRAGAVKVDEIFGALVVGG